MNRLIKVKHLPIPRLPTTTPAWKKPIVEYPKDARILTFIHEPKEPKKKTFKNKRRLIVKTPSREGHHTYSQWTEEEDQRVAQMYSDGASYREISEKVGHTEAAISVRVSLLKKEGRITTARNKPRWTDEQVETLIEMRAAQVPYKEISKALGKTVTSAMEKYRSIKKEGKAMKVEPRMLTIKEVMTLTGFGRSRARAFCDKIGATRKFSERTIRYDRKIIEAELDALGAK